MSMEAKVKKNNVALKVQVDYYEVSQK